jgi:hypothetical protein
MATINTIKNSSVPDTPLLFFQCALPSGDTEYWCTHGMAFNGAVYAPRILKHNLFDLALSADDAMDGLSQVSLTLANADGEMTELNLELGLKGSQLTVYFAFVNLSTGTVTTESTVLFRGIAGDPDETTEEFLSLTFTNKLTLQRIPLPEVRIQRSCPWNFPATLEQRTEAIDGGPNGRFSRFYRCGYSADVGGQGNLNGTQPFTSCDKSRTSCVQRGMFGTAANGNVLVNVIPSPPAPAPAPTPIRFGGMEFVPSAILVRTAGDKTTHVSPLIDNAASYNDPVPLMYGTGWLKSPVIFARNDGNLTHMETLLGMGVIDGIIKVVVNNVEIPLAVTGHDMTATGWYSLVSTGSRDGAFNFDFSASSTQPLGDPHGSLASLSVVVPNRISSGRSVADVEVLMRGVQVDTYDTSGNLAAASTYSDNPAWIVLDILRRCGWSTSELDLATFANAAAFCDFVIQTQDLNGLPLEVSRYKCNLIVTRRQSAAAIVRGIRVGSSLMLRYGSSGLLELMPETTVAGQQSTYPDGGNSLPDSPLEGGGWPVYEFSDDSTFSGIVRNANGTSSLRFTSNSVAQTANRLSVEFQDEMNEYQQDSLSVVNSDDVGLIGYENSSQSTALGVPNFSQANRLLLRQLDKSIDGNEYVQFQTSFRALKVRPGDIIALTYSKTNYSRVPFRVVKLSPSLNYELVTVLAQIHDDDWYSDNPAVIAGAGRQPGSYTQTPLPLIGVTPHSPNGVFEFFDFGVSETLQALSDGTAIDTVSVAFAVPVKPASNAPSVPLLSLSPAYSNTGGTLPGGASYYYAVSAVDATGSEGPLSFTVAATVPTGTNTNKAVIQGLSFPRSAVAFNVYRGTTPQLLYRITQRHSIATSFEDDGSFTPQDFGPPDASFDHANFYYRYQYAGPFTAATFSGTTITISDLGAVGVSYVGRVVRITEGPGRGQERAIVNSPVPSPTTLTVASGWSGSGPNAPGASSVLVIAQASWNFAAVSATSPAQFQISYQPGAVIQITGRGANVNDQEGSPDLCPVTQVTLGSGGVADSDVPSTPSFQLLAPGAGILQLDQIAFVAPNNVSSVTSGTLQVFYWNELNYPSAFTLAMSLDEVVTTVQVLNAGMDTLLPGRVIQINDELMTISPLNWSANQFTVKRADLGSAAALHSATAAVLLIDTSWIVVAFAIGFFENQASGNFLNTVSLPDVRIAAAQFLVTNRFGNSEAATNCYTSLIDGSSRTLSGGQFSLQVNGYLATQQNAAPPLVVQATHAVRDVRATLNEAASGFDILITIKQNGAIYQVLSIPFVPPLINIASAIVSGSDPGSNIQLPPLQANATLSIDIALNPSATVSTSPSPGRDLTVTIRF